MEVETKSLGDCEEVLYWKDLLWTLKNRLKKIISRME